MAYFEMFLLILMLLVLLFVFFHPNCKKKAFVNSAYSFMVFSFAFFHAFTSTDLIHWLLNLPETWNIAGSNFFSGIHLLIFLQSRFLVITGWRQPTFQKVFLAFNVILPEFIGALRISQKQNSASLELFSLQQLPA